VKTIRLVTVAGARPQFVKVAPVSRAFASWNASHSDIQFAERVVHTGQHYDDNMSKIFFDELEIARPDDNLEVGSGTHGVQTAAMLTRIEEILLRDPPDWVLVYGDTNSTLAAALAATKLHIPIAHVEAGLRSFERRMPEEINRIVSDQLSNLLLCPSEASVQNLRAEGITAGVHRVGDVMCDSVRFNTDLAARTSRILDDLQLEPKSFYLATIHRAENTDDPARLASIMEALANLERPVVLPLHPRTRKTLGAGLADLGDRIRIIEPVGYLDILTLERAARIVMTDSGGVQKEAFWLGVPALVLRDQTEWVELVEAGCNRVVGTGTDSILAAVAQVEAEGAVLPSSHASDLYGDGHAAERIVELFASTGGDK
jgi:UDP-N-acetylglucosamine 2-epimerase (non-hydrolysing)/UDP-GlcNAc3NAcA epimerase